mgnify:CR=1 FL=1
MYCTFLSSEFVYLLYNSTNDSLIVNIYKKYFTSIENDYNLNKYVINTNYSIPLNNKNNNINIGASYAYNKIRYTNNIIANIYSETSDLDWSKSFGINDIAKNNPLNKFDQFRIASVTKTFVAATILRLWEEDKINIDDPISKYISKGRKYLFS